MLGSVTWLLGGEGSFSAFLLADTRLTLPHGIGHRDWVRKVHQISSHLVVGCAGSTKIGFDVVERLIADPELSRRPELHVIARELLPRKLLEVFNDAHPVDREQGCQIIVAGSYLREAADLPPEVASRTCVVKFVAPTFSPQVAWPPGSLLCSGVNEDRLRSHLVAHPGLQQMELTSPTALAQFHEWRLRKALGDVAQPGVSDEFVVGVVNFMGVHVQNAVSFSGADGGSVRHGPRTRLASTWEELLRLYDADEELCALEAGATSALRGSTL